jgi:hypothetical protein
MLAAVVRVRGRAVHAIQTPGQDLGGRGFPASSRPGKKVSMSKFAARQSGSEGLYYRILANEIGK